jgi:hypothetical protein
MHVALEKKRTVQVFPVTLLGCSHPFAGDAEQVGFAVGGVDHLSPQTHSLCLWWLQKAANYMNT